ncbi:protein PFC0760c isoform X1 [Vigna umbellata]|uniref:protein PFC0760c isoform X1 n=1 Tax=Vigna umbellata TaxID=87088 RepID=UPI001F5E8D03|nr:protein PFC0760c isoform X1 [Vigna umbellata]XP_047178728.1 protein PFC0760c isoform X1 [Vigna umbellata]XP_047178729.1 protein PFC0760c isoform X1 [Vigna umbellata]
MAADQRRKRVNGANIAGYGSREQQRIKRKNLGLVQNDLNMRSHISVEWDGNQKKVVAKREQVGISWRQTKPFINSVANGHKLVADVLTVPQEIFDLDNLSDVLSYEVWMTHLSENERNLLMNFLPSGFEPHQVVEDLLAGINFNFGNPFTKWGASLCLGDLHPDMIVYREQHLKSLKREYYSHIHNYHNDMIGFLSNLKQIWQNCKDPEKEIVQRIWRSKRVEKRIPSKVIESRVYDHDGNVTGTSESISWDAEDKACSSDNQISSLRNDDKLQRRVLEKDIVKGKSRNLMDTLDRVPNVGEKPKTGDKLPKRNSHSSDGDKYMSYIKISRQQHELVKNMKQSGKSIQSRSLNRVLGNLEKINVQPYNIFVKEEKKKLQERWLLLVNKDLPEAYVNWKERQRQRHAVINSLVAEMKDRSNSFIEEEDDVNSGSELKDQDDMNSGSELHDHVTGNINSGSELHDQDEDMNSGSELQDQDNDNMNSESELQDQNEDSISSGGKPKDQNDDKVNAGGEVQDQNEDQGEDSVNSGDELQGQVKDGDQSDLKDDEDFISRSPEHQSLHNSYVGGDDEFNPMTVDTEKNLLLSKSNNTSPNKDGYSRNMNSRDVSVDEGTPFSSSGDVWQGVEMPHSYYDSAVTHEYTASGLSLANPQASEEQPTRIIDLETDLCQETGKELLGRQLDDGTFSSYQIQDRSVLLPSLFKGEGLLPYHRQQKGADLEFQTSNNVMMGDGQFSSHFKEPLQTSLTLDQGRRRATEVFMPENMSHNIYSDGGRYSIPRQDPMIPRQEQLVPRQDPIISRQEQLMPRQDPLVAVNMTDWTSNNARIAGPSQSHLNTGDFIGNHWFPADQQIRGGWNGSDSGSLSSQSLGTGASSDQSLFSILSECNQLRSGSSYDSVRNTDQFVAHRTYGLVDAGTPRVNTIGPPAASHPLDYFTGREAASGLVPDDMTWMSLPHQNSSLHDQMGKPYLRSWNR